MNEGLDRPLFLAVLVLLLFFLKVITTFLHELGHAVAAIILTRSRSTIYVGSYGDPRNSMQFRSRWIDIWFRYHPFRWEGGICIPDTYPASWVRHALILLAGPLTTVALGVAIYYLAFVIEIHPEWKWVVALALFFCAIDLITNLAPIKRPTRLYNGSIVYSDGYQLLQLFRNRSIAAEWARAMNYLNKQEYMKAGAVLEEVIHRGTGNKDLHRYAIIIYAEAQDLHKACELAQLFEERYEMEPEDFSNFGLIKSQLELYDEGLADYEQALLDNPRDYITLNNRGYTFNLLERYEEAISDFDRAIELQPQFAYSYNNRGLAKIKLGMVEEGLADIHYSLQLDEHNSYAHRNLGIYHFDRNEFATALELFEKSRQLDSRTHLIEHYIDLARQRSAPASNC